MSAQTAADLRAAADVLERDGWTQGTYHGSGGCHCQAGAVLAVVAPGAERTIGLSRDQAERWNGAEAALERHLFGREDFGNLAINWNDEPSRTADEVVAALRAAADAAEAQQ